MKKSVIITILLTFATLSVAQNVWVTIPSGQTLAFDADETAHIVNQDTSLSGYLVLPDSISYWEPLYYPDTDIPYDSVLHIVPVTVIADRAFLHCHHITGISIPATVGYVGLAAFAYCTSLDSIVVAEGNPIFASPDGCNAVIDTRDSQLVCGCRRSVIPSFVNRIGTRAFQGISGLHSIFLPDSLKHIGNYAFYECDSLTSIYIPAQVRNIGFECFSYCWQLDTVTVDDNNTLYDSRNHCNAIIRKWDNHLLQGCSSTIIPQDIQTIGSTAFRGMRRMTHIDLPLSIQGIYQFAFQDCSALTSVRIPANVFYIGYNPFVGCTNLDTITVDSLNTMFDSRSSCNAIIAKSDQSLVCGCRSTVIPSDVYHIKAYAFKGITGIRRITLPIRMCDIGNEAFAGCTDIETILSATFSAPTLGSGVFQGVDPDIPIHIRRGTLAHFLSEWPYFHNFIEDFPVGINTIPQQPKGYTLNCLNGQIYVTSDTPQPVYIFDITGRQLYHHAASTELRVKLADLMLSSQNILLVKVGNNSAEKLNFVNLRPKF